MLLIHPNWERSLLALMLMFASLSGQCDHILCFITRVMIELMITTKFISGQCLNSFDNVWLIIIVSYVSNYLLPPKPHVV